VASEALLDRAAIGRPKAGGQAPLCLRPGAGSASITDKRLRATGLENDRRVNCSGQLCPAATGRDFEASDHAAPPPDKILCRPCPCPRRARTSGGVADDCRINCSIRYAGAQVRPSRAGLPNPAPSTITTPLGPIDFRKADLRRWRLISRAAAAGESACRRTPCKGVVRPVRVLEDLGGDLGRARNSPRSMGETEAGRPGADELRCLTPITWPARHLSGDRHCCRDVNRPASVWMLGHP